MAGKLRRVLAVIRGVVVMIGGSVALLLGALTSAAVILRSLLRGRRPSWLGLAGAGAVILYAVAIRPWLGRWGATDAEVRAELPGDESVPSPAVQQTRAVTIEAPVGEVWQWLAQIGQDRGGFYSYEWLENLAGCRMRNADRVHPEWQTREVGETVLLHPAGGLEVLVFEPEKALVLIGGWYFALQPDGDSRARLIARFRQGPGPTAIAYGLLLELPHLIMERKMLLGIKQRAERGVRSGETATADVPPPLRPARCRAHTMRPMGDVLLVCATTHGHTAKIAAGIAEALRAGGLGVDLRDVRDASDIAAADHEGVIVGASVHAGHHQRAIVNWVKNHRAALEAGPSAFFSVSLAAAEDTDESREATQHYIDDFLDETGWTPGRSAPMAGALQYREYDVFTRTLMRLMMRRGGHPTDASRDYDHTDWEAVDRFGRDFAELVAAADRRS